MRISRFVLLAAFLFAPSLRAFAQERTLLDERFYNNTNSWPEYDNDDNSCRVFDGYYESDVKKADGTWMGSIVLPIDEQRDFTLETTIERMSGVDNYGYGLAWGIRDVNNFYYLNITANGYYTYGKCENAKYTDLIPWTASSLIHTPGTSTGNINKITVKKTGGQLSFYLNDSYLAQSPSLAFYGSKVGFGVYRQMKIHFTSLLVTQAGAAASEQTVLSDEFSNNSNSWPEGSDENHTMSIAGGSLTLEGLNAEKAWMSCIPVKINQDNDYSIETTVSKVGGDENTGYGLVWGHADGSNTLMFKVTGTGYYQIVKRIGGVDTDLIPWEKTDAVAASNGTNKLTLRKVKDKFEVYVNDQFMKSIAAEPLPGNEVGFVVDRLIKIEAKNITVKALTNESIIAENERTLLDEEYRDNANGWDVT
ncbi:MAG TPA: hypothetical protein VI758_04185, partial [Bacteroidota bacterium]